MNSQEYQRLNDWAAQLSTDLGIDSDEFRSALDIDKILGLAGIAAHTVLRPAAPVTTFLVGYAAGLAAASGTNPAAAIRSADETSRASLNAVSDPAQPDATDAAEAATAESEATDSGTPKS